MEEVKETMYIYEKFTKHSAVFRTWLSVILLALACGHKISGNCLGDCHEIRVFVHQKFDGTDTGPPTPKSSGPQVWPQ